jgi:large subunit ribosomal protein L6
MSRIGKKPILIPDNVEVKIEGQKIRVLGPKGELAREVRPEIKIELKGKEILVSPQIETKKTNAFWGLTRVLIYNMVKGVAEGFEKKLEIEGLGFRANLEKDELVLQVGFAHPVKLKTPEGIKLVVEKNLITVTGADKELVGQFSAIIRKAKAPEPYKGKGIRYQGEHIRRKLGKKAVTSGGK